MIDLTSKTTLKPANIELVTEFVSGEIALAQSIGGSMAYSDKLIRGYGDKVIGQSSQGLWIGGANFETAPIRMTMEGAVIFHDPDTGEDYVLMGKYPE